MDPFGYCADPEGLATGLVRRRADADALGLERWRAALDADGWLVRDPAALFPLGSGGRSPGAPRVGWQAKRAALAADATLREALRCALLQALGALGIEQCSDGLGWACGVPRWGLMDDKLVSRMLHCAHAAGLPEARSLMAFLEREFSAPADAGRVRWWVHQLQR